MSNIVLDCKRPILRLSSHFFVLNTFYHIEKLETNIPFTGSIFLTLCVIDIAVSRFCHHVKLF